MSATAPHTPVGLDPTRIPRHVAIIMDGNGRWAKQRGNLRMFGHRHGVLAVRETVEAAAELGIDYLTLYTFSTENWQRPKAEVDALMRLFISTIRKEADALAKNGIRLHSIGDALALPRKCQRELADAIDMTKNGTRMTLVLALNYGSRHDILQAVRGLMDDARAGRLEPSQLDEARFAQRLSTHGMPDPELMIRTSGEFRISNFLLWELAYTELYVSPRLWPDFRRQDLIDALLDYQRRERRLGKTSEQLENQRTSIHQA